MNNNFPWGQQPSQPLKDFDKVPLVTRNEPDASSSGGKMAIPRLSEGVESTFSSPGRFHRRHVSRACESCRQRKTKCTGDKSGCRNCREAGIICCYTDGKREKSKRQLESLEAKLEQYENAFNKLSQRYNVSTEQLMNVASSLDSTSEMASQQAHMFSNSGDPLQVPGPFPSSTRNAHLPEHTSEDFNKDAVTQATGYIGGSSEICWLQKVVKKIDLRARESDHNQNSIIPPQPFVSSRNRPIYKLNYHLDDMEMPLVEQLDIYGLPSKETARYLYQVYLDSVHPSFPIIGTSTFGSQFQAFLSSSELRPGNKWLAILNLIFAISTRYGHLLESLGDNAGDAHLYFARARALSVDDCSLSSPDLQRIQVEGLASLYLLASGQMNRAWKLCGIAVRGAMGLGLHLLNMGPSLSDMSKEIRYRVWWSLLTLENRLSVMTGRSSCVYDNMCTTPMPVPFDEQDFNHEEVRQVICGSSGRGEQMSSTSIDSKTHEPTIAPKDSRLPSDLACGSLYFIQIIKLCSISKRMMSKLYSPEGVSSSRQNKEFIIRSLMIEMDSWCMDLPKEYDFTSTSTSTRTPQCLINQRTSLALLFYSNKIAITQPCLDSPSANQSDISGRAFDFSQRAAVECVEAACHLLRLFPETIDGPSLYRISPWWCVLHLLMQATAIIYLELIYNTEHVPEKAPMVKKAAIKSLDWLNAMAKTNKSSQKARGVCEELLEALNIHLETERIGENIKPHIFSDEDDHLSESKGIVQREYACSLSPIAQMDILMNSPSSYGLEASGILDMMHHDRPTNAPSMYDEDYLPYDPNTGQIAESFFPGIGGVAPDIHFGNYWNSNV